ncbi:MAG TPA: Hsp20/alpha crystallin family protein [Bacilli bacterium]|nr:Hsp20/alpha crystallin family protein [Bacilli bacterium]
MSLVPKRIDFDDFFDDFFPLERKTFYKNEELKCDIYEKDGKYHLEMDIPGFDKNDINVECENGYLTITASKNQEKDDSTKKYIRKERSFNKYQRSFYIGDVDSKDIKADFKNGILNVIVPILDRKENKSKIEIN